MMWKLVNVSLVLSILPALAGAATAPSTTVVRTTKEFRNALYDPRISVIQLQHPLVLSRAEWGLVRPEVKRRVTTSSSDTEAESFEMCDRWQCGANLVTSELGSEASICLVQQVDIEPQENRGGDFVLDLGGGIDLAFVSEPYGEVHFHGLQLRGIYGLSAGGSVTILSLFHVNAHRSIQVHDSTCCFSEEVCNSISNDFRVIAASSRAALNALGVSSCSFTDPAAPYNTYEYPDGCVLPQEWTPSRTTGNVHFHNASLSCAEKCLANAKVTELPFVQVSTADSRQLVGAIGGMISDSQNLKISLLGGVVVYEHQWSRPFTILSRDGTRLAIDGSLEGGNRATLSFLPDNILIKVLGVFRLQLTNLKLELKSFGPGLLSKADWMFNFCDGDDYFYKWPLFLPYPFAIQDSEVRIANSTIAYQTCPSTLVIDEFISSLNNFMEGFDRRDYGNLTITPPTISVSKVDEAGLFFDQFYVSLPAFLGNGASWSPVLLNHFELRNVTVVCKSFGDPIGEVFRCFTNQGSPTSKERKDGDKTDNYSPPVYKFGLWDVLALAIIFLLWL